MTTQEFSKIASKKLNSLSTSDLILEVKKLVNDFSTGTDLVTDIILDILMERMPENEFIALCDSL